MAKDYAYNKRATFDYDFVETYEAGIELLGVEVKSVRKGNISLKGAFVTIHNDEAFLTNATIPPWQPANTPDTYDPVRPRRLLLSKADIRHFIGSKQSQGLTIVPISVYNKSGKIKVQIALARGKKKYDKKQKKKESDIQRDVDRVLRGKETY